MRTLLALAPALLACACAGPPPRYDARATEAPLTVVVEDVIIRNDERSWTPFAAWDEYRVRVRNASAAPVRIEGVGLRDATGQLMAPGTNRGELVAGTAALAARYKEYAANAAPPETPGSGANVLAGAAAVGTLAVAATTTAAIAVPTLSGPFVAGAGAGLAALPLMTLLGPAMIGMATEPLKQDVAIRNNHTPLPAAAPPGGDARLVLFYPVTPLPRSLELTYDDAGRTGTVIVDLRQALSHAHMTTVQVRYAPLCPSVHDRAGVEQGRVHAALKVDGTGRVTGVAIVEAQPPGIFDEEARRALFRWRYNVGDPGRITQEVVEFKCK